MDPQVAAVRRFTRFFTSLVGILEDGYLASPFSVTEARVLYELAHGDSVSAADLVRELHLDAGYVSRLLRDFERRGLVTRTPSRDDGRRTLLALTAQGRTAFAPLDVGADERVARLLAPLSASGRTGVVRAMARLERLLSGGVPPARARPARRGSARSR